MNPPIFSSVKPTPQEPMRSCCCDSPSYKFWMWADVPGLKSIFICLNLQPWSNKKRGKIGVGGKLHQPWVFSVYFQYTWVGSSNIIRWSSTFHVFFGPSCEVATWRPTWFARHPRWRSCSRCRWMGWRRWRSGAPMVAPLEIGRIFCHIVQLDSISVIIIIIV